MNSKSKVVIGSLVLMIFSYLLWTQRPVTVIRAGSQVEYDPTFVLEQFASKDRRFESYDIVVNHFPLTEWGRIHWYLEHKEELKKIYNIPSSDSYTITFWILAADLLIFKHPAMAICIVFPRKMIRRSTVSKKIFFLMLNSTRQPTKGFLSAGVSITG